MWTGFRAQAPALRQLAPIRAVAPHSRPTFDSMCQMLAQMRGAAPAAGAQRVRRPPRLFADGPVNHTPQLAPARTGDRGTKDHC